MMLNAAPTAILNGIQDLSGRQVDPAPVELPIHLPHVLILAERGPLDALMLSSSDALRIYGDKTFDYRKEFAKHTTALAKECFFPNANQVVFQRVVSADAKVATIGFGLDIVEEELTVWERNADGTYALDQDGNKIDTGTTITGHRARWTTYNPTVDQIGKKVIQDGLLGSTVASKIYPMFELPVSGFGKYGKNIGVRLWAPTVNDSTPLNDTIVSELGAFLYRIAFLERSDEKSTPLLQRGLDGQTYVDFSLLPGAYYEATASSYDADEVVIPSYRDIDRSTGYAPEYGPFSQFHIYKDNVALIQELIFATEESHQSWDPATPYRVNIVGAYDENGVPYHTFVLDDVFAGGLSLNESSVYYAAGGADGATDEAAFDELCYNEFNNYGTLNNEFLDIARFPQSVIYDSGFTIKTKKALTKVLAARKDIWVAASTQDVNQAANDVTTESSMAIALRTAFEMQPEATLYGTSVVRGIVCGHAGYLINSEYKKLVPGVFEVAYNLARWAGAGDGRLKGRYSPDVDPNNRVKLLRDLNCTWKPTRVRNKDWDNGMIWFQSYDHLSLFCPALQTVYKDDTSILNSLLNMVICVEVQKVCFRTWRQFTGRSNMTNAQYEEASDAAITAGCRGRFDERVVIVPETYHTTRDTQMGYKSSANVHVYGNNMKTVAEFTVVAHRLEELNAS